MHRGRRDQLTAMVRDAQRRPGRGADQLRAAHPARAPRRSSSAAARVIEQRCASVYADTVGSTSRGDRQWAIDALLDAAVRELSFGAQPERFPGVAEL